MSFQQQPPRLVRWGFHPLPQTPVIIGLTETGAVCRIEFPRGRKAPAILKEWRNEWPKTEFVHDKKAIAKMAAGWIKKRESMKLYMTGTRFQQAVWKELLKIPRGKTLSYAEIARRIKRPNAVRAVGTACGANPVALLVPCHRVIASNGKLGGFGGGLPLKKVLLTEEGVDIQRAA